MSLETVIRFNNMPGLNIEALKLHGDVFDVETKNLGSLILTSCCLRPVRQDDYNDCEAVVEIWSSKLILVPPQT